MRALILAPFAIAIAATPLRCQALKRPKAAIVERQDARGLWEPGEAGMASTAAAWLALLADGTAMRQGPYRDALKRVARAIYQDLRDEGALNAEPIVQGQLALAMASTCARSDYKLLMRPACTLLKTMAESIGRSDDGRTIAWSLLAVRASERMQSRQLDAARPVVLAAARQRLGETEPLAFDGLARAAAPWTPDDDRETHLAVTLAQAAAEPPDDMTRALIALTIATLSESDRWDAHRTAWRKTSRPWSDRNVASASVRSASAAVITAAADWDYQALILVPGAPFTCELEHEDLYVRALPPPDQPAHHGPDPSISFSAIGKGSSYRRPFRAASNLEVRAWTFDFARTVRIGTLPHGASQIERD